MIMTPYEFFSPKLLRFGRNKHKKLPEKIRNAAARTRTLLLTISAPLLMSIQNSSDLENDQSSQNKIK
jgi:hypothetical protein